MLWENEENSKTWTFRLSGYESNTLADPFSWKNVIMYMCIGRRVLWAVDALSEDKDEHTACLSVFNPAELSEMMEDI